jgi:hypothetical protein
LVIPTPAGRTAFDDWRKEFPGQIVAIAKKLVGCSRARTPGVIADFLDLFDLPFKTADGRFVPYAAAAVSFVGAMAYCDLINRSYNDGNHRAVFRLVLPDLDHWYFTPTPSCWDSFRLAAGRRRWAENPHRETAPALFPHPGWIVVYNFGKGADHCGIVETADEQTLQTIEFNTRPDDGDTAAQEGGAVATKRRNYDHVKGFVVTTLVPHIRAP